ncbi:MAG: TonB-dependent receptor [Alphaproteobacteria bacterium]|nr:TonB-dependent receptor [Alphaproteobacteria bacterium]
MKLHILSGASLIVLGCLSLPATAQTSDDGSALSDVIVVTGSRIEPATTQVESPERHPLQGPDASSLLSYVPGGARVSNGALTGQAQYRGLFGPRINVRIDGQSFASGGPNLMDPPFHYAPLPLIAALEIDRGVSPVRNGPGIGGGMNAVFKKVNFGDTAHFAPDYDLTAQGRSGDESWSAGGVAGAANDTFRFNILGAYETGEDTHFPDGRIRDSGYERSIYGVSTGLHFGDQEFGLDVRRQNAGPAGTPALPMDIMYVDTDFARLTWTGSFGGVRLDASGDYTDVAHAMDNYSQRPAPVAAMQRRTDAGATTRGAALAATFDAFTGKLRVGADYDNVEHNAVITNPNNADFRINSLPDITMERAGLYAEWTGDLGPLRGELGLRTDHHDDQAGLATVGTAVPAMAANLAAIFNAADRSRPDNTLDAVARLWTPLANGLSWRLTLARKTRTPGYVERFSWLPTSASGGLADGNIYVGDLDLKPEVAWIGEVGVDYAAHGLYLRPTIYIRQIDNYIQGVPFDSTPGVIDTPQEMVANMNGDPTPLRFANVDARIYGVDVDAGIDLPGAWRVDGVASWLRGERRDIDDNLYRISPPSLTVGLSYDAAAWSATLETRLVAEQNDVSVTNSEQRTGGYDLLNLYGNWKIRPGATLSAGIENVLDTRYDDHLSGYNRVMASDVPLGQRLPGPGRSVFLKLGVAT